MDEMTAVLAVTAAAGVGWLLWKWSATRWMIRAGLVVTVIAAVFWIATTVALGVNPLDTAAGVLRAVADLID